MADILSQEEVDALLEIVEESCEYENINNYRNGNYCDNSQVILYDFKRPNRVTKSGLRFFKYIHDIFAKDLERSLTTYVKNICEIQLHSVDQMTFGEFLMSIRSESKKIKTTLNPLNGILMVSFDPQIVYETINLLTGSLNDEEKEPFRDFTDLENFIFDDVLENIYIPSLNSALTKTIKKDFNLEIISNEQSLFNWTNDITQNEQIIMIVMEIIIGNASGMLNFAYPVKYVENTIKEMSI